MAQRSQVLHEVTSDGSVHSLVLCGTNAGNILDEEMCRALVEELGKAAADVNGKLVVVSGDGDNFSYGASIQESFPERAPRMLDNLRRVLRALLEFPYPTLAAVEGKCLGGGFELALACGMIIADSRTVFAFPEIKLGSIAPYGTVLAAMRLPRSLVEELLLTGKELNAGEARQWGLVNRVVAAGAIENAVFELAQTQIMPYSAATLRIAAKSLRQQYLEPGLSLSDRLTAMERVYIDELVPLEDAREGIRAFLEQRYPGWRNR